MPSLGSVITSIGPVKPHVRPVAEEIANRWPLYFIWGAPGRGTGDHAKGLALDFMVYNLGGGVAAPGEIREWVGNEIATYVIANRQRLNVAYVIWNRRIASAKSKPPWSWRPYDGEDPHENHVHVSFNRTGAYQASAERTQEIDMQLSDQLNLVRPDGKREWAGTVLGADHISVDGALGLAAAAGRNSQKIIDRLDQQNALLAEIRDALKGTPS
jgi:hypothetical protein